ncbi:MAG TPA: 50S ribosomal protein L9 [Planctomycetaceae bacterium]|nr:50S ribosomal protein L9 [Planctomycetaceae bacterium]
MPEVEQHKSRRSVELLLTEDVAALGKQGEIVQVRSGYARNFLLPQGLATVATEHNKRMVEKHRKKLADLDKQRLDQLKKLAEAISKYSVTIEAHANEEGHLYGSIGAADISKSLRGASFDVSPECVRLEGPLKELAMYTVKIQLHPEIETEVKVWVVPTATHA